MQPYEELTYAILENACKDYIWITSVTKKNEGKEQFLLSDRYGLRCSEIEHAHSIKKSIKRFFNSQWFELLTDINPDWLIEKLEKKAEEKYQKGLSR